MRWFLVMLAAWGCLAIALATGAMWIVGYHTAVEISRGFSRRPAILTMAQWQSAPPPSLMITFPTTYPSELAYGFLPGGYYPASRTGYMVLGPGGICWTWRVDELRPDQPGWTARLVPSSSLATNMHWLLFWVDWSHLGIKGGQEAGAQIDGGAPPIMERASFIFTPYWLIVLPTLLAGITPLWLRHPQHKRKATGLCLACGYDLRATPSRCPECGRMTA